MTTDQAFAKVDRDQEKIKQALSDLQTVKALMAVGENEKALNLFANLRMNLRLALRTS